MTTHRAQEFTEETVEAKETAAKTTRTAHRTVGPSARPMTGEEYIGSIRDGREVYLYGGGTNI